MTRTLIVLAGLSVLAAAGPLDRYNEGVAKLGEGEIEDAIAGFEAAAVSSEGKLRAAALFNLGLAHARKADAIREAEPEEPEGRDARMRRLTTAAESYRRALALFHRVPAPAPDAERGAKAVKLRLLAALDEIRKLAEEARKEAEEKALADPPRLLLETLTGERDRRRAASRLEDLTRRRRRIPARRLRQAEYEARSLMEKLAAALETPPEEADPAGPAPAPESAPSPGALPPELAKAAAEAVRRGAAAMAEAEGRLDGRDAPGTVEAQGRAISELAAAARRLPADLPALVGKLLGDQESLRGLSGAGASPILAAEEAEIRAWLAHLGGLPDPAPEDGGGLTAETAAEIRRLAGEAEAAAGRAGEHLAAGRIEEADPEQAIVIERLEKIRELLPRPPESPAEKIRKLIREEGAVGEAVRALPGLGAEARAAEAEGLGDRQTENGRTAGAIAMELEGSPGEREKEAAGKVREAEGEVHASAESLRRDRDGPAGESVDRAIEALEEALRILSGEQEREPRDGGERQPQPKEDQQQDVRKLSSREARRQMEEMDRERREEEEKLFRGLGGPKVEKDW